MCYLVTSLSPKKHKINKEGIYCDWAPVAVTTKIISFIEQYNKIYFVTIQFTSETLYYVHVYICYEDHARYAGVLHGARFVLKIVWNNREPLEMLTNMGVFHLVMKLWAINCWMIEWRGRVLSWLLLCQVFWDDLRDRKKVCFNRIRYLKSNLRNRDCKMIDAKIY